MDQEGTPFDLFDEENVRQMSINNIEDRIEELQAEVEDIKVQEGRHRTVHRYRNVCV